MQIQLPQQFYPLCAPLPLPMVEHLLTRWNRNRSSKESEALDSFLQELQIQQRRIFSSMDSRRHTESGTEEKKFSIRSFHEITKEVSPNKKRVHPKTLQDWYDNNLLRRKHKEDKHPTYESAAALLIARAMDTGARRWYPSEISKEDEAWWCIVQETPEQNAYAHPISLLAQLPHATLCWTPCWAGAAWDTEWIPIRGQGAIRWAGVVRDDHAVRYTITLDDLEIWDSAVAATLLPGDDEIFSLALMLALHRLSRTRVKPYYPGSNIDSFYRRDYLSPQTIEM